MESCVIHETASLTHGRSHSDSLLPVASWSLTEIPRTFLSVVARPAMKERKCLLQQKVSFWQLPDFFKRFMRELTVIILIKDELWCLLWGALETPDVEECQMPHAGQQDVIQMLPACSHALMMTLGLLLITICVAFLIVFSTFLHNLISRSMRKTPLINCLIDTIFNSPPLLHSLLSLHHASQGRRFSV